MNKLTLVVALFIVSLKALCQKSETLNEVATACSTVDGQTTLKQKINSFTAELTKKRTKSDLRFLQKVFYKTHQKFLKNYTPYTSIDELVETGSYDCLTATALYASILEILGYHFKIIETNYHIFILASVNGRQVLLETTDRLSGFISSEQEIADRIMKYQNGSPSLAGTNSTILEYNFRLLKEVKGYQLPGLIYFNQAVKEFNKHNWYGCRELLAKSSKLYDSPRVPEILNFVMQMTPEKALVPSKNELPNRQETIAIVNDGTSLDKPQ